MDSVEWRDSEINLKRIGEAALTDTHRVTAYAVDTSSRMVGVRCQCGESGEGAWDTHHETFLDVLRETWVALVSALPHAPAAAAAQH